MKHFFLVSFSFLLSMLWSCHHTVSPDWKAVDLPELRPVTAQNVRRLVTVPEGNAVLLDLWAVWCKPCTEKMPKILELSEKYRDRGLKLLLVSVDFSTEAEAARQFLRERGVRFPSYIKTEKDMTFINGVDSGWSGSLPTLLLYGAGGERVKLWEGAVSMTEIEKEIVRLLQGETDGQS